MTTDQKIKKMDELYETCLVLMDELGGKMAQLQRLMKDIGKRPVSQPQHYVDSPVFPSPENVLQSICDTLSQRVDEVKSPRRYQALVEVRVIASGILKELFADTITQNEIGRLLGNRDHTTIHKTLADYNHYYYDDVEFQAKVNKCKGYLYEKYQIPIKN